MLDSIGFITAAIEAALLDALVADQFENSSR